MGRICVGLRGTLVALAVCASTPAAESQAPGQAMSANDLHKVRGMLREGYETVRKNYYDPTFHGLDLEARFKEYDERLKTAPTMNTGMTLVAAFLEGLKDSHTNFQPPAHAYEVDYGYRLIVIGNDVFVERVRPETDAVTKVRPGDQVVSVNGGGVGRDSFFRMQYLFQVLQPQPTTRLVLRDPQGRERTELVNTKVTPGRVVRNLTGAGAGMELQELERQEEAAGHLLRQRYVEQGSTLIWKMPLFFVENAEIDRVFGLVRKHESLILDLRGNPGGLIDALRRMLGHVFPKDVVIGERVTRKGRAAMTAKSRGDGAFPGKLIVLIDSASGSAAELFARIVQLEHRGVVIGDRSAGAVMEARLYPFAQGSPVMIVYGFSITDADIVMTDGRSLEGLGVTPDEVVLPTAQDLAAGRDPAMARAAVLAGIELDAVTAATLFPYEWK